MIVQWIDWYQTYPEKSVNKKNVAKLGGINDLPISETKNKSKYELWEPKKFSKQIDSFNYALLSWK